MADLLLRVRLLLPARRTLILALERLAPAVEVIAYDGGGDADLVHAQGEHRVLARVERARSELGVVGLLEFDEPRAAFVLAGHVERLERMGSQGASE